MCFRGNFHNVIYVQTIRVFSFLCQWLMYALLLVVVLLLLLVRVANKIFVRIFFFYNCLLRLYL